MHIRTFRAANLQAALADIRDQMGPQASVLHTRQVRDGWLGWLGRSRVEVTAGLNDASDGPTAVANQERRRDHRRVNTRVGQGDPAAPVPGDSVLSSMATAYLEELKALGVDHVTAQRWLDSTTGFHADLGDHSLAVSWDEQISRTVSRATRLAGPIRIQPGEQHVVALIGPTGVGKTTTIAKLAAGFRLESRRSVGLLTIDTFRIAAVQQLESYAQIMDLPMEVVESHEQMQEAMERLSDVDLVLIDTAGRSPRSDARIDQLTRFLEAAKPDETHLVVSATSSPDSIRQTCRGFAPARPTSTIVTKLDEVPYTAGIVAALNDEVSPAPPISYLTAGQQVPDDIEVASAETLVENLLPPRIDTYRFEAA